MFLRRIGFRDQRSEANAALLSPQKYRLLPKLLPKVRFQSGGTTWKQFAIAIPEVIGDVVSI